ncbi:MAG: hypothetical protein JO102_03195 [Elusimicrobia bacterium]|nr:hypothetical protein [Elusimicrobiota bacterium]
MNGGALLSPPVRRHLASPRRILIASVSAGAGHVRAAEALQESFRILFPYINAVHANVLDHARPRFRRLYEGGYSFLVNKAPSAWKRVYRWTDTDVQVGNRILDSFQRRQLSSFVDYVRDLRPDRIIATHFMVPALLEALGANERPPIDVVVTDYDVHRLWVHPLVDRTFVASEQAARRLLSLGVSADRIVHTGIPIHPVFLTPVDRTSVLVRLSLSSWTPTILVLAGGGGFAPLAEAVKGLFTVPIPVQIIAVCGRNAELKKEVDSLTPPPGVTLRSIGFASNMHQLIGASDLVVTKPGGLTIAETLAKGTPMLFYSAIPGQEELNADYVCRKGAALRADLDQIPAIVTEALADGDTLDQLKLCARAIAQPRAGFSIARYAAAVQIAR